MHYDKHLGIADITVEEMKDLYRRRFPSKYDEMEEYLKDHDYDVFIDFEEFFGGIEKLLPYQTLLKVIRTNTIAGALDKSNLANFLIWQNLRSHAVMRALLEGGANAGVTKFETFLNVKMEASKS